MKGWMIVTLTCLSRLLPPIRCAPDPVNCQWGPFGEWSACDGCTQTQSRSRPVAIYAQFNGLACTGESTQTHGCVTAHQCPLQHGCGERFRCRSGKCISQAMVCNGDQDCEEDGLDEHDCDGQTSRSICDIEQPPPSIEHTGLGFDVLKGTLRDSVINTKSFGGHCSKVFSGDHKSLYRKPQSLLRYDFNVKADNDFLDEFYNSMWSYKKEIEKRMTTTGTTEGFHNYDELKELTKSQTNHLVVIKSQMEVVQFQSTAPEYLPIAEGFWKSLVNLPTVYDYGVYRNILEKYGTHYFSEGSFGGQFKALLSFEEEEFKHLHSIKDKLQECVTTTHWIFFIPIKNVQCRDFNKLITVTPSIFRNPKKSLFKVEVAGGNPSFIAALQQMNLENPTASWEMYQKWAGSVKNFPQLIKQKLRPLYDLVKEVSCSGLKRLLLRRAVEQYLAQSHPCHCRPCQNNGQPVVVGLECRCTCPPGTEGLACEKGQVLETQPGVIHGSWTCWSSWGSCSGGQRSRHRACTNPPPRDGGRHCIGHQREEAPCESEDFENLRNMEPHCFDSSVTPQKSCGTPPPLRNGFVLNPKDLHPVGSKVEYTCIEGFHLIGQPIAACLENQTWSRQQMECQSNACSVPSLSDDVIGLPWKPTYEIGEKISLTCPPDRRRDGDDDIICDSSLNWSPDPKFTKCRPLSTSAPIGPNLHCRPWEKPGVGTCVCRAPHECGASLEVCAVNKASGRVSTLSVCKLHALQCMGRPYVLSVCEAPPLSPSSCPNCTLWETCDVDSNTCRCRTMTECVDPGIQVCVQLSGVGMTTINQTMGECEAGLRKCRGEAVRITSINPCSA